MGHDSDATWLRQKLGRSRTRVGRVLLLIWFAIRHPLRGFPNSFLIQGNAFGVGSRSMLLQIIKANYPEYFGQAQTHPLFDPSFYLAAYPDVRNSEVNPWLHFQLHGLAEGRSPHALIDPEYIEAHRLDQLKGINPDLEAYLDDPAYWDIAPVSCVNIKAFMAADVWNQKEHPLLSLIRQNLFIEPFLNPRISVITAGAITQDDVLEELSALRVLWILAGSSSLRTPLALQIKQPSCTQLDSMNDAQVVIPGFAFGSRTTCELISDSVMLSRSMSAIRTQKRLLVLLSGELRNTPEVIVVCTREIDHHLLETLQKSREQIAVAPFSNEQQSLLIDYVRFHGLLNVDVLPFGQVTQFAGAKIRLFSHEVQEDCQPETPFPEGLHSLKVVLLRGENMLDGNRSVNPEVSRLLDEGAVIVAPVAGDYRLWAPVLRNASVIYCDKKERGVLRGFFPQARFVELGLAID